jgi:hypothetical protein
MQSEKKMIVLTPDGEKTETPIKKTPGLSKLQNLVGGYIEVVPFFDSYEGQPCVAVCNEEGRIRGMRLNRQATEAFEMAIDAKTDDLLIPHALVGPVVILIGVNLD